MYFSSAFMRPQGAFQTSQASNRPRFAGNTDISSPYDKLLYWMKQQPRWGMVLQDSVLTPTFEVLRRELRLQQAELESVLSPVVDKVRRQVNDEARLAWVLPDVLEGELAYDRQLQQAVLQACMPALERAAAALEQAALPTNMPNELKPLITSVAAELRGRNAAMPATSALSYLAVEDLLGAIGAPCIRIEGPGEDLFGF